MTVGPEDETLRAYVYHADLYLASSAGRRTAVTLQYLDAVAGAVGDGCVLELGSGPGWDGEYVSKKGTRVILSDAAWPFVDRLRQAGYEALHLDVRDNDWGGPYDGVMANAVLHHLDRDTFESFLDTAARHVTADGILAFSLRQGDGEIWSSHKLGVPRRFVLWRQQDLEGALLRTGWTAASAVSAMGADGASDWLFVIARRTAPPG